jgi:hypothetical protein
VFIPARQSRRFSVVGYAASSILVPDLGLPDKTPVPRARIHLFSEPRVHARLLFYADGRARVRLIPPALHLGAVYYSDHATCEVGHLSFVFGGGGWQNSATRVLQLGQAQKCIRVDLGVYAGWIGYPAAHILYSRVRH